MDNRPVSEPALHLFQPSRSDEEEAWIDRFMRLENILKLCQIKDTGIIITRSSTCLVDADRANQIINKYNLIYSLCLSPEKISEALSRFRNGGHILLEPVLCFLKEL
ncbi:uncharacterized protein C1orf87 homolog [Leptodactylus fuscus]